MKIKIKEGTLMTNGKVVLLLGLKIKTGFTEMFVGCKVYPKTYSPTNFKFNGDVYMNWLTGSFMQDFSPIDRKLVDKDILKELINFKP
jgi:hypothetical protein